MVQDATILYSSFIGNTASFEGNHIYAQGWNIHAQQNYWSTTPIVPNDITSTVDVSLPLSNDPTLNYSIGDYYNPSSPCTMASPVSFPMTSPTATPSPTLTPTSIPSYTPTASATPESFYYYDFRLQQYPWVEDPGYLAQVPVGYRAYSNWVAGVGYEPSNIFYGNFSGSNRYIRGSQLEFQFSEPLPIDRIWIRAVGVYGSDKHLQLQRASDGQWVGTMNFNHSWTINVGWTVPGNGSGSLAASQGATEYYTAARYLYAQASGSSNYPIGHVAESLTIYLRSPAYPFPTPTPTLTPTPTPAICEPSLMGRSTLDEDCITPSPSSTPSSTSTNVPPSNLVGFDPNRYTNSTSSACASFPSGEPIPGNPNTGDRVKCWIHGSILEWMTVAGLSDFGHEQLIELIVESEYRSNLSYFTISDRQWPDEALARRFYSRTSGCGTDGCQTTDNELYMFLSTYQAPRNYVLDTHYRTIVFMRNKPPGNTYWINEVAYLENAVNRVLNPPIGETWTTGILNDAPYGWGTRQGVSINDVDNLRNRLAHCNGEGFAYVIPNANENLRNIFFGVTVQTQGQTISTPLGNVTCSFSATD